MFDRLIFNVVNLKGDVVTPALFCGVFVGGDCGDQGSINDWTVDVPADKPDTVTVADPADNVSQLRVLHLADVHVDLTYTPGTNVDCGLPCCCMQGTEVAGDGEKAAGSNNKELQANRLSIAIVLLCKCYC